MFFAAITEAKIGGCFFKPSILPQHFDIRYASLMVFCVLYILFVWVPQYFPWGPPQSLEFFPGAYM